VAINDVLPLKVVRADVVAKSTAVKVRKLCKLYANKIANVAASFSGLIGACWSKVGTDVHAEQSTVYYKF